MFQYQQEKFIYSQIIMMTLSATLQRNKVYLPETGKEKRDEIRKEIERELESIGEQYLNQISERVHEGNIIYLSNSISEKYSTYLEGCRFRIGTAQKALNLFLKYLWCLKKIHEPPHFPIDSTMLSKIPGCSNMRWTKFDSICDYKKIIEKAKNISDKQTLAIWELCEFNRPVVIKGEL